MSEMTTGQMRVGISFNPSNNGEVQQIKMQAAELIDTILDIGHAHENAEISIERMICRDMAARKVEEAAMWAVKAATKGA